MNNIPTNHPRRAAWLLATAAAVFASGLLAAAAQAGSASVSISGQNRIAQFNAQPGETNALRTSVSASGKTVLFTDTNQAITPGAGCAVFPQIANTVQCSLAQRFTVAQASLGDGSDTASIGSRSSTQVNATGGDENDQIVVRSGTARSSIGGNDGDDKLTAKSPEDGVSTLRGGDGNDTLKGGKANDWLIGDDGNDTLTGLSGKDKYSAGNGDDKVFAKGDSASGKESVNCGKGRDAAALDNAEAASAVGCESKSL